MLVVVALFNNGKMAEETSTLGKRAREGSAEDEVGPTPSAAPAVEEDESDDEIGELCVIAVDTDEQDPCRLQKERRLPLRYPMGERRSVQVGLIFDRAETQSSLMNACTLTTSQTRTATISRSCTARQSTL